MNPGLNRIFKKNIAIDYYYGNNGQLHTFCLEKQRNGDSVTSCLEHNKT